MQSKLCELNPAFFCSFGIEESLQSPPDDKNSLVQLCGMLMNYFRCMRNFETKCEISYDFRPYKYLPNSVIFVWDICLQGSYLNQDYLRFAKCYKSAIQEITVCRKRFGTAYDSYFSPYEIKDPELIEEICDKHQQNVDCISEEIRKKCGPEAKHVFLRIVHHSKYLQMTCPKYDNDN
ncbi:hypothetical protein HNY73_015912 [Argiope bruennichi]|uniref:DUF19 domain-containing protein n=1 Tax=Argiope bruennichi TaxID=94029 RepID=A0A8T0EKJ7_ARGBR|nr:hypothetical protein HNY73_015912 [Argiope bruennichi]